MIRSVREERERLRRSRAQFRRRLFFALSLALAGAVTLSWRWHYLQVQQFDHYYGLSSDNRIAIQPVGPMRGMIFDREGRVLAENRTSFQARVASDHAGALLERLDILRGGLSVSKETLEKLEKAAASQIYLGEVVLKDFMTEKEVMRFIGVQQYLPEVVLDAHMVRHYPLHNTAVHLVGNVARITPEDKERIRKKGIWKKYLGTLFIGKRGIEANYETRLHGSPGLREAYIDAHGRVFNSIQRLAPTSGENLWLTIDLNLQRTAEDLLAGRQGAIAALNPHTGAILALATSPRYDINDFIAGVTAEQWRALNSEESGNPLTHRAIYGHYSPGSTIKPFLALAALSHGWRDENYVFKSVGQYRLTSRVVLHDWKEGGHGDVDLRKSIVRSVNSFYYKLAHEVGVDAMHDALSVFGLGSRTGIDIEGERAGVLPTQKWKREKYGEQWYLGDTVMIGVGQGYLEVTPLQLARAMAVIANGGRLVTPRLVAQAGNERVFPAQPGPPLFKPEHLGLVREALAAVTRPGGTAYSRVGKGSVYPIAGKTGTAQVTRLRYKAGGGRVKNEKLPEHLRDHAWFVGYAPAHNPEIVVAVLVEHGGSGGRTAGPIARAVMDEYLLRIRGRLFGAAAAELLVKPAPAALAASAQDQLASR